VDFLPETFTNTLAALPEMDLAAFLRVHAAKGHTHTGTQKRTGEGVTMNGRSVGCFSDGTPGRGVNISGKDSSCCVVITAALIFAESRGKSGAAGPEGTDSGSPAGHEYIGIISNALCITDP
jgi:hypothetical protein